MKKIILFFDWLKRNNSIWKAILVITVGIASFVLVTIFWLKDLKDYVLGTIIALVFTSIIASTGRIFSAYVEDEKKVCVNTEKLKKIYKREEYNKTLKVGKNSIDFLYNDLECAKPNEELNLVVEDKMEHIYQLPDIVANAAIDLIGAHRDSSKDFTDMVRLDKYEKGTKTIKTSRTNYFNHLVTNRAADFKINDRITLREIYEYGPKLKPLEESAMSNHIGINALVFTNDGYLFIPKRSGKSTVSKHKITSSIAAGFKLANDEDEVLDFKYFKDDEIRRLLHKRLNMPKDKADKAKLDVEFLGFGRNIYEAGKPQFYFAVTLKDYSFENILTGSKELIQFNSEDQEVDQDGNLFLSKFDSLSLEKERICFKNLYYIDKKNTFHKCKISDKKFVPERSYIINLWHYYQKHGEVKGDK